MDINEKIAARRRELEREAELQREAEKETINNEVRRRLLEKGVDIQEQPEAPKDPIDEEVDKALLKLARSKMTQTQNLMFGLMFMAGILLFFYAWFLGLSLVVIALIYKSMLCSKYKAKILEDGIKKLERNSEYADKRSKNNYDVLKNRHKNLHEFRVCVYSANRVQNIKNNVNENIKCMYQSFSICIMIVITYTIYDVFSKDKSFNWFVMSRRLCIYTGLMLLLIFILRKVMLTVVAAAEARSVTGLHFSDRMLTVSFPSAKGNPEFPVPWKSIGEVVHKVEEDCHCFDFIFVDDKVVRELQQAGKRYFGSGFWYGSPIGSGLTILSDSKPDPDLLQLLADWQEHAATLPD